MKQLALESKRRKCLSKFLYYFRKGYSDPKYYSWEREYKQIAHEQFRDHLNKSAFKYLLQNEKYKTIAEIGTNHQEKDSVMIKKTTAMFVPRENICPSKKLQPLHLDIK